MKARTIICAIAAMFIFSGASPWEGAGAVAPEGELPATGRYIATNTFPVNTIVDITNIESSKSTRVIVANSLNSPGLLAIVSFEAAELIGMRPGSVSRIRMVQPSDPIAYLRFTEGVYGNIPEYDSGNVLNEEKLLDELYGTDSYRPPAGSEGQIANADGTRGPSYTLEPEWSGRRIIDLPGYVEYPLPEITQTPVEVAPQVPVDETPRVVEQTRREIIKDISDRIVETPNDEVVKTIPSYITEVPADEAEKTIAEFLTETRREEVAKDLPDRTETSFILSPTTERPPEDSTIYGIDPSSIIPGLAAAPQETTFSVPRIFALDRGSYYVQIAAVDTPDQVESTVYSIDRSYQPKVYKDGDNWYRILLGPLNQGESAAILQRFKSFGFSDAFVRRGS